MSWFKVDDHLHSHRKTMRAGTEAMGLWVLAGSWSAAEESDGWVPSYVLPRLVGGDRAEPLATLLVLAGLWSEDEVDGEQGYRFRSWGDYQPTRAQLEAKRADARDRMRRAREQGGDVRANGAGTSRAVTPTPTRPDPTHTNTTAADAADTDPAFAAFWATYPNRKARKPAERAWAKATRTTSPETIMAGLHTQLPEWRAHREFPKYVPMAATWLNQERWTDEPATLPGTPTSPAAITRAVFAQCDNPDDHPPHEWADRANTFRCHGTAA